MPKQTGIPMQILVDDAGGTPRDISNDVTHLTFGTTRGEQNVTGIDKSAMERLLTIADGKVTLNGVFNPSANKSHTTLSSVVSSGTTRRCTINIGIGTGLPQLTMVLLFTNYDITRAQTGDLTWSSTGNVCDGNIPAWGVQS